MSTWLEVVGRTEVRRCRVCNQFASYIERRWYLRDAGNETLVRCSYWAPVPHHVERCGTWCEVGAPEDATDVHSLLGCAQCEHDQYEGWFDRWLYRSRAS